MATQAASLFRWEPGAMYRGDPQRCEGLGDLESTLRQRSADTICHSEFCLISYPSSLQPPTSFLLFPLALRFPWRLTCGGKKRVNKRKAEADNITFLKVRRRRLWPKLGKKRKTVDLTEILPWLSQLLNCLLLQAPMGCLLPKK